MLLDIESKDIEIIRIKKTRITNKDKPLITKNYKIMRNISGNGRLCAD